MKASLWKPHPLLLLLLATFSLFPAHAATVRIWTGGSATSGNWSAGGNWIGGVAPVAGDVLSFSASGARKTSNTNNFPAGRTFSSLNLFGTGYRLRGNSVTISNSVTSGSPSGTNRIDLDLAAAGPGVGITLQSFKGTDRLTLNGDIDLNDRTLFTDGPGDFIITGVISGNGGIFKNNSGDLSLSGLGANTFRGPTSVNNGILRLNRYIISAGLIFVGTTAIPGNLSVGALNGTLVGDIVVLENDNQIANTSHVLVASTGSLELSGESDTIGELRLLGGAVSTGSGVLSVEGPIYAATGFNNKDSVISGRLSLGGRAGEPQVIDVAQAVFLHISAAISGGSLSDLIKTNRGELYLSASNTFSGDVEIKGGTLTLAHGHALGNTNGVTKPSSGTLAIHGTFGIPEALVVPSPAGRLVVDSGSSSWLGNVTLEDDLSIDIPTNSFLTIVGRIAGPAGWTKSNAGTLQFKTTYTNTYAGTSWVREGNFIMDGVFNQPVVPGPLIIGNATGTANSSRAWPIKQNQISDTSSVTLNRSGALDLGGFSDTIGGLIFNGGAVDTGSGLLTLNGDILVNATNQTASISGNLSLGGATRTIRTTGSSNSPDLLISAVISDGGWNKKGAGMMTLTGTSTYVGESALSEGTVIVNGSIAASEVLRLNEPAFPNLWPVVLGGHGTVSKIQSHAGGILAPGTSPGRLTVQGELALTNAIVRLELNGPLPGVSYDQLRVNGPVRLGDSQLELSFGFTPAFPETFILIENDGNDPVQGTFAGIPQGGYLSSGDMVFSVNYQGGAGNNDVILTRVAAPPSNISSITPQNEKMVIQGQGLAGLTYVLEFTPHLKPPIPWAPVATNHANGPGVYQFLDTYAENGTTLFPARFYRVVSP